MSSPAPSGSSLGRPERPCAHCGTLLPASARFCGRCGKPIIKDFFISYNRADRGWAEWIAWNLEAEGYSTLIQAWDFRPGSDFILEMDQAAKTTRRTIAVLSPDYLNSLYTKPEWADALRRDPTGAKRLLLPVRVRECEPEGLLALVVYLDLLGLDEQAARERLLAGLRADGKPASPPTFPAPALQQTASPAFPAPPSAGIWNVPHRRNPYFTGREETLEQVHRTFTTRQGIVTQALTGLGGIGKTQTALEYAFRYQQEYQAVFWVQAETRALLSGDLVQIATLLELPEREAQEQEVIIAAVRRWLESHSGWLLVLDNVEDAALVEEVLPTRGSGHILLTARAQVPGTVAQRTDLKAWPPVEATRFLLRRVGLLAPDAPLSAASPEQRAEASAIALALGHMTLALDQAGAYIEDTGCSLADYLTLFHTRRADLLSSRGAAKTGHTESVAVTWAVAFEQARRGIPAAADLLRICAFLHPEAISEDLFRDGAAELPSALQKAVNEPLEWNAAISALRRFSLIERQTETQTLSVHRLVQTVLQDALPDAERREWAERTVRLVSAAFPDAEFANWERCQQLLPHALVCASHTEQWHLASQAAADMLNAAGSYLHQRAQYEAALPLLQQALAIREQVLGPDHPEVAQSLNNLAELYREQGQYGQALTFSRRALEVFERALGSVHPVIALVLNNLALIYQAQGQYAEALLLYQRALEIDEEVLGPIHPEVARHLNNLAELYRAQGQYDEARPRYQQALAIWEQALGPAHPLVATGLNNLALVYQAQGQYAEALSLHQRSLAIDEQALGPDHPNVAQSLNNLAELYRERGQYAEALPLYQRSLAIVERALGPNHPNAAQGLNNMALLYHAQGKFAEALPLYQWAQAIAEQALGPDHPFVATCLNNIAELYRAQEQYAKALPLLQQALKIDEQAYGPNHPDVGRDLNNLALIYHAEGHYQEALPLYQQALKLWEQGVGPNHPNVATCLENLAALLDKMGEAEQARALQKRAQTIRIRRGL